MPIAEAAALDPELAAAIDAGDHLSELALHQQIQAAGLSYIQVAVANCPIPGAILSQSPDPFSVASHAEPVTLQLCVP